MLDLVWTESAVCRRNMKEELEPNAKADLMPIYPHYRLKSNSLMAFGCGLIRADDVTLCLGK